jgi:uncharacterized protein (TIGR02996 family)
MGDRDAILEAIFAAPADDAPRLVYADWLEEHGDPEYAAFIRLRCQLARLANGDREWAPLRRQLHRTWESLRARWAAQFPRTRLTLDHFPRGLPTRRVEVSAAAVLHESPRWWPTFPITDLRPTQWATRADQFAACPYLRRVRVLDLTHQSFGIGSADAIIRSPHLGELRCLWVSDWVAIPETVRRLRARFGDRVRIWDRRCPPSS